MSFEDIEKSIMARAALTDAIGWMLSERKGSNYEMFQYPACTCKYEWRGYYDAAMLAGRIWYYSYEDFDLPGCGMEEIETGSIDPLDPVAVAELLKLPNRLGRAAQRHGVTVMPQCQDVDWENWPVYIDSLVTQARK